MSQTVAITGTSRGIGKALAEKYLAEGWQVIGTYNSTQPTIEDDNYTVYQTDVSDLGDNTKLVDTLQDQETTIDILINNAGIGRHLWEEGIDIKTLQDTLDVNLIGLVDLTEKLLPLINTHGHIINVSSAMGALTVPTGATGAAYRISKAGVNMYTKTLASRLGDAGPTVSCIHPGRVQTDMGGENANLAPDHVAEWVYPFSQRENIPTGKFWQEGEQRAR